MPTYLSQSAVTGLLLDPQSPITFSYLRSLRIKFLSPTDLPIVIALVEASRATLVNLFLGLMLLNPMHRTLLLPLYHLRCLHIQISNDSQHAQLFAWWINVFQMSEQGWRLEDVTIRLMLRGSMHTFHDTHLWSLLDAAITRSCMRKLRTVKIDISFPPALALATETQELPGLIRLACPSMIAKALLHMKPNASGTSPVYIG
ncbi:uncharacterized protein BT62DRAFT_939169 [Guyanagaster necrorhizus]|uniref:Uncharacterized protein n=1 Tax=Guyanagaster necrorhizus TaxID=856835 RepID=A0A9P7VFV3_9AGAR|nr:uncharacterized protein BT62DRAFT_939169 [Guyanagaster necrorhizus MCA 3950]KAG7439229.1 hypothetical protein BT62DRAFT_939169 [Guyanagaster necrorhizus MCA 3950]